MPSRPTDFPVVIVTGGSYGIARAIAGHGYVVVIAYLPAGDADGVVAEIERAGGASLAIRADVGDELDVERLFDETAAAFGGADVVVHTGAGDETVVNRQAADRLRPGGAIFSVADGDRAAAALIACLRVWRAARESPRANGR